MSKIMYNDDKDDNANTKDIIHVKLFKKADS